MFFTFRVSSNARRMHGGATVVHAVIQILHRPTSSNYHPPIRHRIRDLLNKTTIKKISLKVELFTSIMSFQPPHLKSAIIGGGVILAPSGEMSEIFEDGDNMNRRFREQRLEIFMVSKMRGRWLFGCDKAFPDKTQFGDELSRTVSRMSTFGKVCTCVLNFTIVSDMKTNVKYTDYGILRRIHQKLLANEPRCAKHPLGKSPFA